MASFNYKDTRSAPIISLYNKTVIIIIYNYHPLLFIAITPYYL